MLKYSGGCCLVTEYKFYKEIEYWNKNNTKRIKVYSISLNFIELILILLFLIIIDIFLLIYIIV